MNFFNFKEENRNKQINQRIILVMFAIAALQAVISSYKSDIKIVDVQVNDTPAIILLANNA